MKLAVLTGLVLVALYGRTEAKCMAWHWVCINQSCSLVCSLDDGR